MSQLKSLPSVQPAQGLTLQLSSCIFVKVSTSIISKQKGKADLRKTVDTLQKLQNKIYGKQIFEGEWEQLCLFSLERECHHLQTGAVSTGDSNQKLLRAQDRGTRSRQQHNVMVT